MGVTFQLSTDNANWAPRNGMGVVSLNNGVIIILGGLGGSGEYIYVCSVWRIYLYLHVYITCAYILYIYIYISYRNVQYICILSIHQYILCSIYAYILIHVI